MYKVVVSKSPLLPDKDEYGPYRFMVHAWLVAWYITTFVNEYAEAVIYKRVK